MEVVDGAVPVSDPGHGQGHGHAHGITLVNAYGARGVASVRPRVPPPPTTGPSQARLGRATLLGAFTP